MRRIAGLAVVVVVLAWGQGAQAAPIVAADMLTNWSQEESPSRGVNDTPFVAHAFGIATDNLDGALISDFIAPSDFIFSAQIIIGPSDVDTVGMVFGYQDPMNHYRVGFHGGGSPDGRSANPALFGGTGAEGLWLVREQAGVGTDLFNLPTTTWSNGATYNFTVARSGGMISFSISEVGVGLVGSNSVTDTVFPSGRVGYYTESQGHAAGMFDFQSGPLAVPEPTTLLLLGAGLGIAAYRRRRQVRR